MITPTGATDSIYGTVADRRRDGLQLLVQLRHQQHQHGSFPVTIDVTEAQKSLFAGASATVSIIVEQRDNVLVVPTAAVTTSTARRSSRRSSTAPPCRPT